MCRYFSLIKPKITLIELQTLRVDDMCNLYSCIMKAESAFHDLSSVHLMSYHRHFNVVYCEISACVMECILKISFMHCPKLIWVKKSQPWFYTLQVQTTWWARSGHSEELVSDCYMICFCSRPKLLWVCGLYTVCQSWDFCARLRNRDSQQVW